MFKAILARVKQGYKTGKFPLKGEPKLPDNFMGRPEIAADADEADAKIAAEVCPTKAISCEEGKLCLDMGKCIFCGKCAAACSKIKFTKDWRLAAFRREDLIIRAGDKNPFTNPGETSVQLTPPKELVKLYKKSLKLREVSAGGCAACELDFNVLGTLAWDMGRFGISVVASPRHADGVLVTGPITKNMALALEKTHAAMPEPNVTIACGSCAISGGIYADSEETSPELMEKFKPDLYIPGCPPHPATTLDALVRLCGILK